MKIPNDNEEDNPDPDRHPELLKPMNTHESIERYNYY